MRLAWTVLSALALSPALWGCAEAKPKPAVEVEVKVTSDPGKPLEGAEVLWSGKVIKTTDKEGIAKLSLQGNEGDTYDVTIKCPAGYQSPTKPLTIPLRRLVDPKDAPEYDVRCPPTTRTIVVAVRAENGAHLPILHLGRILGRTDESGAATVLLKDMEADGSFDLMLDTSEKGNEGLRPQNPSSSFTVKRSDDVLTLDTKFTIEVAKKVWHGGPKKVGPIALPTKTHP